MARARSVFALSALAVAATTVAACSPSVSSSAPRDPFASPIVPGQSARASSSAAGHGTIDAPTPRSGSGTVTVALVGGAQLPMETAQEFTKATGFTVAAVPVDGVDELAKTNADVVLGLDGADALQASASGAIATVAPQDTVTLSGTAVEGAAGAVAYGRDDVCVIADKSWMSANGRPLPTSFGDLTSPRIRALLAVPDPASSSVGRAFVQEAAAQTGEGLGSFAQSLNPRVDPSLGATVGAWTAGAHVSDGYLSEVVGASAGTSGAYPLVVAPRSLAAAADTKASWLMGITGEAVVADETVGSLDALDAWVATWSSALAAPAPTPSQTPAADAGSDPGASNAGQDQAPSDETGDGDPGDEE